MPDRNVKELLGAARDFYLERPNSVRNFDETKMSARAFRASDRPRGTFVEVGVH